jgi:hypothetical protein
MGEKSNAYRALMGKIETRRPTCSWDDNINPCILEKEDGLVWTRLMYLRIGTYGRLLGTW